MGKPARKTPVFQCGMCEQEFYSKDDHRTHRCPEPTAGNWVCVTCNWTFTDSLALEEHQIRAGHRQTHACDNCPATFPTSALLGRHRQFPSKCSDAMRRKQGSPTFDCEVCKKTFRSKASYDGHFMRCQPPAKSPTEASKPIRPPPVVAPTSASSTVGGHDPFGHLPQNTTAPTPRLPNLENPPKQIQTPDTIVAPVQPPTAGFEVASATHACDICKMFFRSKPALKVHREDKHGIGGKTLDLTGRDSWMLSAHARQQLRDAGILRSSPGPNTIRPQRALPLVAATPSRPQRPPLAPSVASRPAAPRSRTPTMAPAVAPPTAPPMAPVGGHDEMAQANTICGQIMRLVLQCDVFIRHVGNMTCSGIDWTRISCAKQADIVGIFADLCHLPPILQSTEFVPVPQTFRDEYKLNYPAAELKSAPDSNGKALKVVAISCQKVVLENGLQEAVKIAAVDVVSCRILMNHLICTDPKAPVKYWRTTVTGLAGWQDVEAARQAGYKVLKGWNAARAALWRFIDRNTILVGYNIRSDLDSLRMVHGRAVDVAKVFEKAAKGPLSKQQLSIESLCRDLPAVRLTNHPVYGRDALQNAFAAREIGLWMLKNKDDLAKKAKQKSLDFQRLL